MEIIGQVIVAIIMICAALGCIASIVRPESELAQEFTSGIDSIGPIFLPVAGIMASAPYLSAAISYAVGPLFAALGADKAMAATSLIAIDMGGYQLANTLAATPESWIMAAIAGYMSGATIVFTIPVALKMLQVKDRKFLAIGAMCGLAAVPFGVLFASIIIALTHPQVRSIVATSGAPDYVLQLGFATIAHNMVPLVIFCGLLAVGLYFIPKKMISGFNIFGTVLNSVLKVVFVLSVIEYFTHIFSNSLIGFGFDPIIADEQDLFRALEVSGAIGMMLCGAFPMVYFIKKYLTKPLEKLASKAGMSGSASAGILAASANVLAALAMVKDLAAKDKVYVLAFSVGAAFLFGDHLSFTANFQPSLILIVMLGKLCAGIVACVFATWFMKRNENLLKEED